MISAFFSITLPIILILARGPQSLSKPEAMMVYRKVQQEYLRIGINLRLERMVLLRSDPSAKYASSLEDKYSRFGFMERYVRNRFPFTAGRITFAMMPPVIINGDRWGYGRAQSVCAPKFSHPFAFGAVTRPLTPDGNSYKWAIKIMAHEIGHLLEASHDSEGIMQPNVLPWPLYFSPVSKEQIRRCVRLSN